MRRKKQSAAQFAQGLWADFRLTMSELRDPTLALWALYIVLFPVYVWRSGLPQPGDLMVIVLAPVVLLQRKGKLPRVQRQSMRNLWRFTGWTLAVNMGWTVILGAQSLSGKTGFYISPIFYFYNALVFLVFLVLYQLYGTRILHITGKLIFYTLTLNLALAIVVPGNTVRTMVLFNNPNQLGYYALLSASLLVILHRHRYVSSFELIVGSLAATYLSLLSQSRAALGGIIVLAAIAAMSRMRTALIVGLIFLPLFFIPNPMTAALEKTMDRIEVEGDFGTSFIEERGYDRILAHPEFWALGAGEGNYIRFKTDGAAIGSHEIHSSIGTLFFCYGFVGLMLMAIFVWSCVRKTGMHTAMLIMPSLAYGMTHQALRFTLFWIVLAVMLVLRTEMDRQREARRAMAKT